MKLHITDVPNYSLAFAENLTRKICKFNCQNTLRTDFKQVKKSQIATRIICFSYLENLTLSFTSFTNHAKKNISISACIRVFSLFTCSPYFGQNATRITIQNTVFVAYPLICLLFSITHLSDERRHSQISVLKRFVSCFFIFKFFTHVLNMRFPVSFFR